MLNTFLHTKFKLNINNYIKNQSNILIAISSGQDSLCLLKLLNDILDKNQYQLQAIYVDHQWKKDSKTHSEHIINIMKMNQIPTIVYQIKKSTLSELESRKIRYKIFIQHALKEQCSTIITGHNKNDHIETFLHNIFRGTSLQGITNFTISKRVNYKLSIFRPLINFTKSEIAWFCRLFYLPIWSDITNYNFYLTRNRLRHEMIPYLKNYFNPKIENNITDFIHFCENENEYIQENTLKLYIKSKHKILIGLNLNQLNKQHNILQQRVVKLYFHYNFHKQINKNAIIKILNLTKSKTLPIIYFNDLQIYCYKGWLYTKID